MDPRLHCWRTPNDETVRELLYLNLLYNGRRAEVSSHWMTDWTTQKRNEKLIKSYFVSSVYFMVNLLSLLIVVL